MKRELGRALFAGLLLLACGPATTTPGGTADGGGTGYPDGGGGCSGPQCLNYCPTGTETVVTGLVTAPNGIDPVPGAIVYVPYSISEFPDEVSCEVCSQITSQAVTQTTTAADGTFTLPTVPTMQNQVPGQTVTIISQKGRFRRVAEVPIMNPCAQNAAGEEYFRLPGKNGHYHPGDRIPRIAVATGDWDSMECVLLKLGLQEGAFDLYEGGMYESSGAARGFDWLLQNPSELMRYNIVFIDCAGNTYESLLENATIRGHLYDYVSQGGRLYVTDWSYDYIEQVEQFAGLIDFEPGASGPTPEAANAAALGPGSIEVDALVMDPGLVAWLHAVQERTGQAIITASDTVHVIDFLVNWVVQYDVPVADTVKVWLRANVPEFGDRPLTVTFDYASCGRGLYSSYHTRGRGGTGTFPSYCSAAEGLDPQERILEYLILHIADCLVID